MLDASIEDCGISLGDPERLKQVVGNLLSNAIKVAPSGGRISVRCAQREHGIELVVEDTGEGIAPEFLPRVFERFRQADSSISRRHGGLGLGLAIARRLVELHGGRITAHSEGVGRGARFTIHLPVHDPVSRASVLVAASSCGVLSGRNILVVEDDTDSREALAMALELQGAHLRSAGSVDEAPVVAVSGFATPEDRGKALGAGFSALVAKPVDVEVLFHTVAGLIGAA